MFGVACTSVTSCVAVGSYTDTSNNGQGLLLSGSGTSWTATEPPLPAGAPADVAVQLQSVACPSASACVAVGQYLNPASGFEPGLLLAGSGTSWTATEAPLPANAAASPSISLFSVACPSATSCVAAGGYTDSSGDRQGLLLTGSGTSWQATEEPLPSNAITAGAGLSSVACLSVTACVAASSYTDSSGNNHGVLVTGSGSSWTATETPLPPGAAAIPNAQLDSVACQSAT
jgi:hypothetical protein